MDLHHFRAHQGSFSPSNPSNPELTITGSQTSNSPTTQTFIYQPNPLIPQRGILKSIPWGQEDQELQPQPQTLSQSSFSSPLASPSHLLPGGMPVPGAVGGGGFSYVKSTRRITPYRGFAYTPTRPSTGRLSRITIGDPDRQCGFWCWFMFLFACAAILGLGSMWLFQVLIFAHRDWPADE